MGVNHVVRGKFLTIEGVEGVGKTTHLPLIVQRLEERGLDVIKTREPGGTPEGDNIRKLLLEHRATPMPEIAETLLIFAARAEHIEQLIRPALAKGTWVVCDRFTDATYAYQGGGRRVDIEDIRSLETMVQGDLRPDYTLLLDAPVELGLQRARQRAIADRFESEQLAFFQRVRAAYLNIASQQPERVIVIDAAGDLKTVQERIERALQQVFTVQ